MLHRSTVAAQGVCLPLWEMLQLVTKELVSGKRGSVKQRSGRQSKRKEQRQWEWKETDLTVRRVAKERKEKTEQHVPNISLVNQSLILVCRGCGDENRYAGGTHLEVDVASRVQNKSAGVVCQKLLCLMWVVQMSWCVYYARYGKGSLLNSWNGCTDSQS